MAKTNDEILQEYRRNVLLPLVTKLKEISNELAQKSIQDFKAVIKTMFSEAIQGYLRIAGVQSVYELNSSLKAFFSATTVSQLNSALPIDYPYIVAVLSVQEENAIHYMCLPRQKIPGMHELINRDIVPICFVKTGADALSPNLKITDVRWSYDPDNKDENEG